MTDDEKTELATRLEQPVDDEEPGSARLVVVQGPELGTRIALDTCPLVLGRSTGADFRLSAPGVSRQHCRFDFRDGAYWVEDLGSTNHTRVNEQVVETHRLADGDRLRLGQTVLKYIAPDNPEAIYHDKLHERTTHDPETGLYNRQYFIANLEAAVDRVGASPEEPAGGILYLQLDAVTDMRERIGLAGIEQLLEKIGRRVTDGLDEQHMPARFGEHSIAVLIDGLAADDLVDLARTICDRVASDVFDIRNKEVAASLSAGVCPFSLRLSDADAMLVCAARVADRIQQEGGNDSGLYKPEISARGAVEDDGAMLALLREALAGNNIQTLFQPAVSALDEDITNYQLLPRLLTDDDQLIPASEFLPAARRHGEVLSLDRWMHVRALGVVRDQLASGRKLRLFITQSAEALDDARRFESLAERLEPEIVDSRLVVIEFAQGDLMDRLKAARTLLPRLRELGYGLSVVRDDKDPDPERLLSHFDIDYFKLSATAATGKDRSRTATRNYDAMAERIHAAGARIIISQVEDAETLSRLWQKGADLLQGNFIQKPSQTPDFSFGSE